MIDGSKLKKETLMKLYVQDRDPKLVPSDINKTLCDGCTDCCEHIALEIDAPESWDDFQNIYWYLLHQNIKVFIEENDEDEEEWYIEFSAKCKMLDENGLCKVHNQRPLICKEYSQETCVKYGEGEPHKIMFENNQQLIDYVRENTQFKEFPNNNSL